MQCSKCNTQNDPDSKFCKECGQQLIVDKDSISDEQIRVGELIYTAYKQRETGKLDEAIIACQGALAINEASAPGHSLLASLYEAKGDIESAIPEYERALELNPNGESDQERLIDLKVRLLSMPAGGGSIGGHFEILKPFIPYASGIAALCLVLILCFSLLGTKPPKVEDNISETKPGIPGMQPTSPQVAPIQPYAQRQYPQGQYQQPQQPTGRVRDMQEEAQNPSQAQQPSSSNSQRRGVPPVSVPRTHQQPTADNSLRSPVQLQPLQPVVPKENPVIVPVMENPGGASKPESQQGTIRINRSPSTVELAAGPEERALQSQKSGNYKDAISAYQEALSKTNDKGRIYQQIAISYQRLGQHDAAVNNYNSAIREYQGQLSSGRDVSTVQRNIRACEAGIQVSQPQAR